MNINFNKQSTRELLRAIRPFSTKGIQKINLSPEQEKIIDNMISITIKSK